MKLKHTAQIDFGSALTLGFLKFKPLRTEISRSPKSIQSIHRYLSRLLEMVGLMAFESVSVTGRLASLCQATHMGFGSVRMVSTTTWSVNRLRVADKQQQHAAAPRLLRAGQRGHLKRRALDGYGVSKPERLLQNSAPCRRDQRVVTWRCA